MSVNGFMLKTRDEKTNCRKAKNRAIPEAVRGGKNHKMMNEVKLGDKVKSTVSGFAGTVTAKCEYLNGSPRCEVTASELTDGEVKRAWFEASELIATE